MNQLYHRYQSQERPGAQWSNARGVVVALMLGAVMWACGCGAVILAAHMIWR